MVKSNYSCSSSSLYTNDSGVCHRAFIDILTSHQCLTDKKAIFVMSDREEEAGELVTRIQFNAGNENCTRELVPFLCLNLFGLCGNPQVGIIQTNSSYCEWLRDEVCLEEWNHHYFADCTTLPSESSTCTGDQGVARIIEKGLGVQYHEKTISV